MNSTKHNFGILFLATSVAVIYFATRLYNISHLPMFTDEAIYTRWSQIARFDANWRFISLTDGKQPSFVWFDMTVMRFVRDPLLSGRLVSVLAGFISMVGIFFLASELFKSKDSQDRGILAFTKRDLTIGVLTSFLYILYPFSLVYDRMALYDSLVATSTLWSLYFEILLVRYVRLDVSLLLGMIIGGGLLTKTSAFFSIYLLPFSLLLFNFKKEKKAQIFLQWLGLSAIAVAISYAFYSILRLSPFFHIIDEKNAIFVYPIHEWITHPFRFFFGNLKGLFNWFITYVTPPMFVILIVALVFDLKKFLKEKLLLIFWFIIPFVSIALFGKILYPRFILFMTMPIIVLLSYSLYLVITNIKSTILKSSFIIILVFMIFRADYYILFDFARAPIPYLDLEQYINGWPAGGGLKEVISYFENEAKKGKIYVLSTGTFGSLPTYAVEIYLGDNKNVEKRGIYPIPDTIPKDLITRARLMPVYVFFSNQSEFENNLKNWPLEPVLQYQKGIGSSYTKLYRVRPSSTL